MERMLKCGGVTLCMLFTFGAPLHHVDFNLTLPKPNDQCDLRVFGKDFKIMCKSQKTDYMRNYFRFNIRIKVSTIAFSQPSISFWLIFRVSSFLIHAFSLSPSLSFFFIYAFHGLLIFRGRCLTPSIYLYVSFIFFAVWTFYTVMRDKYSLEKSSPQLFKISSACTDC